MEHIYLLQNTVTNRVYVGRTYDIERRIHQHMTALRSHRHTNELMQSDFDKYGENSFRVETVESAPSLVRSGKERMWILRLKTYDKRYGYNYKDPSILHWNGAYSKDVNVG